MDPLTNPYAPGAGIPPPELAGRDGILAAADLAVQRRRLCRRGRSLMFIDLRGVGKTVRGRRCPSPKWAASAMPFQTAPLGPEDVGFRRPTVRPGVRRREGAGHGSIAPVDVGCCLDFDQGVVLDQIVDDNHRHGREVFSENTLIGLTDLPLPC